MLSKKEIVARWKHREKLLLKEKSSERLREKLLTLFSTVGREMRLPRTKVETICVGNPFGKYPWTRERQVYFKYECLMTTYFVAHQKEDSNVRNCIETAIYNILEDLVHLETDEEKPSHSPEEISMFVTRALKKFQLTN